MALARRSNRAVGSIASVKTRQIHSRGVDGGGYAPNDDTLDHSLTVRFNGLIVWDSGRDGSEKERKGMGLRRSNDARLMSDERLERGYVIILPGIEGRSLLNRSIRKGLLSADVPFGIEIHDWTYGPLWMLWNIRDHRRHQQQARLIADKIVSYRQQYPQQPVYLVGHSGGGGVVALSLAALPEGVQATGGIMIVGALSPRFDLRPALQHTERGLWNFSSYGDCLILGAGTTLFGTVDGCHVPAAGMVGFRPWSQRATPECDAAIPLLREIRYQWRMAREFNLGGHFGCVNPRFVRKWIAPIVLGEDQLRESVGALRPRRSSWDSIRS